MDLLDLSDIEVNDNSMIPLKRSMTADEERKMYENGELYNKDFIEEPPNFFKRMFALFKLFARNFLMDPCILTELCFCILGIIGVIICFSLEDKK